MSSVISNCDVSSGTITFDFDFPVLPVFDLRLKYPTNVAGHAGINDLTKLTDADRDFVQSWFSEGVIEITVDNPYRLFVRVATFCKKDDGHKMHSAKEHILTKVAERFHHVRVNPHDTSFYSFRTWQVERQFSAEELTQMWSRNYKYHGLSFPVTSGGDAVMYVARFMPVSASSEWKPKLQQTILTCITDQDFTLWSTPENVPRGSGVKFWGALDINLDDGTAVFRTRK